MISAIITTPTENDILSLKKLWKDIFKDSDSYIELFFSKKFNPATSFVIKENNDVCGMLFAELNTVVKAGKELKGAYLCGIATGPDKRGKGYASKLINHALENLKDVDIFYLIPAEESLFDYYERFGFKPFTFFDKVSIEKKEVLSIPEYKQEFSYEILNEFYEKSCNGVFVKRSKSDFEAIYDCYKKFMIFENGYIVYYIDKGVLNITEYTTDFETASSIGAYIMNKYNLDDGYILKRNGNTPFSACRTKVDFHEDDKYVNLMLNWEG